MSPNFDGTGPWWAQGRWNCWRARMGRGFGRGFGPYPAMHPTKDDLKAYVEELKAELNAVEKMIKEME